MYGSLFQNGVSLWIYLNMPNQKLLTGNPLLPPGSVLPHWMKLSARSILWERINYYIVRSRLISWPLLFSMDLLEPVRQRLPRSLPIRPVPILHRSMRPLPARKTWNRSLRKHRNSSACMAGKPSCSSMRSIVSTKDSRTISSLLLRTEQSS